MNKKLFADISVNTLQVLINQLLGVFIFLIISRYLPKAEFGEFSWCLAVLTFATTILSLRLEQIVVRNTAAGEDPSKMLTLFFAHNLLAGLAFYALVMAGHFIVHGDSLLWLLAISQLLLFFGMPFRQILTGKASFIWLAVLSSISNLIRAGWLMWLIIYSHLTMDRVLVLFTVSSFAEFLLGCWIVCRRLKISISNRWKWTDYKTLIQASRPQIALVLLNAGIARIDWILLGLLAAPAIMGEYAFAYRAYEFAPLPLLVLAPFVLNRFASSDKETVRPETLDRLVKAEMILATLPVLLLNIAWTPIVDLFTDGKYGHADATIFLILSFAIPFQYLVNLFWSREFASDRLTRIVRITAVQAVVMVAGDLALIPLYGAMGAAAAYTIAMIVQFVLYYRSSGLEGKRKWAGYLMLAYGITAISAGVVLVTASLAARIGLAIGVFAALATATRLSGIKVKAPKVDWVLLLFLVMMLNVKFYVKAAALILVMVYHYRSLVPRLKQWMWFYPAMALLALGNFLVSPGSWPGLGLGCLYWLLAMAAAWHISVFVRKGDSDTLHRTASLFFLLNAAVMLAVFFHICIEAGTINPYTYRGEHQKYYISTGDMITGVTMDSSVTAALISAFGVVYFLYRQRIVFSLICLTTMLLAGSNFITLVLMVTLAAVFIMHTNSRQKWAIVSFGFVIGSFFWFVSPENKDYAVRLLARAGGKNPYEVPLTIPQPKVIDLIEKSEIKQRRVQMTSLIDSFYTADVQDSMNKAYRGWEFSGRLIAWQQMAAFFVQHPARLALGAGMGNFSSKLAYKTAAIGIEGSYPENRRYISPFFRDNYLYIYLYYHSRDAGQHSLINKTDSVYGQLLGEYGLAGIVCFIALYVVWFIRQPRRLTYGLPLLLLLAIVFFTGYWFEQLSIVILFEFLLLLDKRNIQGDVS